MATSSKDLDVSGIDGELSGASVHGRVIQMSPVKVSRKNKDVKYVEGRLSDGKNVCRFISFDVKVKEEIERMMEKGESVSLMNCAVKRSKGGEYEVVMSKKSTVFNSPKKFKIADEELNRKDDGLYEMERLDCIENVAANVGNRVVIQGKLVSIKKVEEVKPKDGRVLKKQECILSDATKGYRLVLWENHINCVESGKSYRITNVSVRVYQGEKYLSMTDDSEVLVIDDIVGEVCEKPDDGKQKFVGEIVGIVSYTEFLSCVACDAKVSGVNKMIGKCEKCDLRQQLARCKKNSAARVLIEDEKKRRWSVSLFGDTICWVICNVEDGANDVETSLLCAGIKEFEINSKNVVVGVQEIQFDS